MPDYIILILIVLGALLVFVVGGCGGTPEPTGALEVSTATTGDTLDPDGYTVTMAEIDTASGKAGVRDTQAVRPSGTVTFEELPEADYEIALSGVQVNCLPKDSSSQRVSVPAEDTTEASFTLTCAPALLDRIVFTSERKGEAPNKNPEIYTIRPDGSRLTRLTHNAEGWTTDRDWQPVVSPHGRRIAFLSRRDNNREIYTVNPNGENVTRLTHNDALGSGHAWDHSPAFAPEGSTMVYDSHRPRADGMGINIHLYAISLDGGGDPTPLTSGRTAAFSPDGEMIVYQTNHLSVMNADGSEARRLTRHAASDPVWSPDGREIVFISERNGNADLYAVSPDGSALTQLTDHDAADSEPTYCSGGGPVVFISQRAGHAALYALDPNGSESPVRLTNREVFYTSPPVCSPDGERVAFVSGRDGNVDVYTVGTDGTGLARVTEHPAADEYPDWSPAR